MIENCGLGGRRTHTQGNKEITSILVPRSGPCAARLRKAPSCSLHSINIKCVLRDNTFDSEHPHGVRRETGNSVVIVGNTQVRLEDGSIFQQPTWGPPPEVCLMQWHFSGGGREKEKLALAQARRGRSWQLLHVPHYVPARRSRRPARAGGRQDNDFSVILLPKPRRSALLKLRRNKSWEATGILHAWPA